MIHSKKKKKRIVSKHNSRDWVAANWSADNLL